VGVAELPESRWARRPGDHAHPGAGSSGFWGFSPRFGRGKLVPIVLITESLLLRNTAADGRILRDRMLSGFCVHMYARRRIFRVATRVSVSAEGLTGLPSTQKRDGGRSRAFLVGAPVERAL